MLSQTSRPPKMYLTNEDAEVAENVNAEFDKYLMSSY